jgi:hypothetical protein
MDKEKSAGSKNTKIKQIVICFSSHHNWFMLHNSGKVSGLVVGMVLVLALVIAPVAGDSMTRENGVDRDGNDYHTLFMGNPGYNGTPESCSENCLTQPACNAATWAAHDQSCWLKQVVPAATTRTGVISFTRVKTQTDTPSSTVAEKGTIKEEAGGKKTPGFGWAAAISGCLGLLLVFRIYRQ